MAQPPPDQCNEVSPPFSVPCVVATERFESPSLVRSTTTWIDPANNRGSTRLDLRIRELIQDGADDIETRFSGLQYVGDGSLFRYSNHRWGEPSVTMSAVAGDPASLHVRVSMSLTADSQYHSYVRRGDRCLFSIIFCIVSIPNIIDEGWQDDGRKTLLNLTLEATYSARAHLRQEPSCPAELLSVVPTSASINVDALEQALRAAMGSGQLNVLPLIRDAPLRELIESGAAAGLADRLSPGPVRDILTSRGTLTVPRVQIDSGEIQRCLPRVEWDMRLPDSPGITVSDLALGVHEAAVSPTDDPAVLASFSYSLPE